MFSSALLHAPTQTVLFGSFCLSPSTPTFSAYYSSKFNCNIRLSMAASVRIVIVGDVHDDWNLEEDSKALELLRPDLVLFTGDFGNENVKLVRSIAALKMPKAAILGNHDAWNTLNFSENCSLTWSGCLHWLWEFLFPVNGGKDAVQLQLESFGEEHVGYKRLDFHSLKLSVLGGRPFSNGGQTFFRKQLLTKRYGVQNMRESANKICEAAVGTPKDHSIIILAHNGPTGLGSNINDICGRDWVRGSSGDHGDPDLAVAISQLKGSNKYSIPVVVFGHMHKELAFGNGPRKMIVIGDDKTIYLNGAIVPRVKRFSLTQPTTLRAFTLIHSHQGQIQNITETWVSVSSNTTNIEQEHVLYTN